MAKKIRRKVIGSSVEIPITIDSWVDKTSWTLDPYGRVDNKRGLPSGKARLQSGHHVLWIEGSSKGLTAEIEDYDSEDTHPAYMDIMLVREMRSKAEVDKWLRKQLNTLRKVSTLHSRSIGGFLAGMF